MSIPQGWTYYDAVQWLRQIGRSYGQGAPAHTIYSAIQAAYRRIQRNHKWAFYVADDRIPLQAAQTTGTVVYDHSGGGTCERQLTLTDATWPSDVQDWAIQFDDLVCEVEKRHSDTVVQLDAKMCPVADVSSTTYTAFQRWYPLQNDFRSLRQAREDTTNLRLQYLSPARMDELMRWTFDTGDVYYYTIRSAPGLYGAKALFVHGASESDEALDLTYRRWARPLRYHGEATAESAGTIAVTAGSTTVTGTGTSLDVNNHAGSLFWIGDHASTAPTGWEGGGASNTCEPWVEQRSIRSVASTTSLTLDGNVVTTQSGVKYRITDPIDIDQSMVDAFLACCETEFAKLVMMSGKSTAAQIRRDAEANYQRALREAKGAESDVDQRMVVGEGPVVVQRLAYSTTRPVDED